MAKKAQMTLEEFAEKYNRAMDWNRDILKTLDNNITSGSKYMQHIIVDYLYTDKITPETCDFSNYEIFDLNTKYFGKEKKELKIYNYKSYDFTYYYLVPDETEEEYKSRKIDYIVNTVIKHRLEELEEKLKEKSDLETIANMLSNKKD